MNERPCKNCYQLLEDHFIAGEGGNTQNWCYPETHTDMKKDHMYYSPMNNLEYLAWCYEKTL